jgi:hypothetical protein
VSWVRFGSKCHQGFPFRESACSFEPEPCPGSDVYVYEDTGGGITCCGCRLLTRASHNVKTEAEMRAHLAQHVRAGHHVPMSLYDVWAAIDPEKLGSTSNRRM